MLNTATAEAKRIKEERAKTSEKKLSVGPQTKRPKRDRYDVHICTPINKIYNSYETTDQGHHGECQGEDLPNWSLRVRNTDHHLESHNRPKQQKRKRNRKLCYVKCTSNIPDNVVNLLSYQLSNREIDILSKGLSYIPYNRLTKYVRDSDITDFVGLRYAYRHIPPSDNPFKLQTKRTPAWSYRL